MGRIPHFKDTIFPDASIPLLNLLANVGLVLFLFIVGVELNPKILIKNGRSSLTISLAGIAIPFALGVGVGYGLYNRFGDPTIPFSSYLLFIGVAMSITAFPVLARILTELNLLKTVAGLTAFSAGVVDDVTAWVLLALVVTIINSTNLLTALYILLLAIAWVLIVVFAIRPVLMFFIEKNESGPTLMMTSVTLLVVLTSAFVTNVIGIHAIFGGFLIGVIMPHEGGFAVGITEKIEDLVNILFLPIYFALSGLKTQIGLIGEPVAFGWVVLVIVVAMFGKISGCTAAAKLNGLTTRESFTVGVFMSCKGLVELIVLNIGFDAGIITQTVFTIMVVMALITTFVTTPLALWLYPHKYQRRLDHKADIDDLDEKAKPSTIDTNQGISSRKNRNLLVVLDKVDFLPAMMTFIQLLQHSPSSYSPFQTTASSLPSSSSQRESTATTSSTSATPPTDAAKNSAVDKKNDTSVVAAAVDKKRKDSTSTLISSGKNGGDNLIVHVLRILELTQRISTVIKFNESEETILHDPIMNVFKTFGKLNSLDVKANLAVVSRQDFAQQISDSAEASKADSVIVPWGGAGAVIDDPTNMFEEMAGSHKNKTTSPQVSHYIQGVFRLVSEHANVFVFVDRGLGVSKQRTSEVLPTSITNAHIKVLLPFFGGKDDRAALKFVVKLTNNPNVTVEILRIKKSNVPTDHDATLKTNLTLNKEEPESHEVASTSNRPILSPKNSTSSTIVIEGRESDTEKFDDELIEKYFGKNQSEQHVRISYYEISSSTPLQTAVEKAKEIVGRKDLVVIGRGRDGGDANRHRAEFLEVIKNIGGSYGNETRKSLGIVAESFLFGGVSSSILVVQSKKINDTSNSINNENVDDATIETGLSKSNVVIVDE